MNDLDIEQYAELLGPKGPGYAVATSAIPEETTNDVTNELLHSNILWYPQHNQFTNVRGIEVTQAFDVYAHKYSQGDQEAVRHMPAFHSLGTLVNKRLVEPLAIYFPTLSSWQLDELTAQRYEENYGWLSWHRDLARHPGVVAICGVLGAAMLGIRSQGRENTTWLQLGDILLLRAPGLFDPRLIAEDIGPEHAVLKAEGKDGRISVTARANSKPNEPIKNFRYANWQPYVSEKPF